MLQSVIICLTAFTASFLTLFSGFGLSTVLLPVFAIFFPLPLSVAATAIVHLANNLFKAAILGKYADKKTVLRFGIPAALTAIIGAYLLGFFSSLPPLITYQISTHSFQATFIGLIIGFLVILAAFLELAQQLSKLTFDQKYLIPGGLLSGFFGGLSGFQGMLRSAFLIKAGLTKEQFIGTGIICSLIVDAVRLSVYGWFVYTKESTQLTDEMLTVTLAACFAAFAGAYLGSRFMEKLTYQRLRLLVGIMLMGFGLAILTGLIRS